MEHFKGRNSPHVKKPLPYHRTPEQPPSTHGLSGVGSVFQYEVEGNAISSTFPRQSNPNGSQVGTTGPDTIELLFTASPNESEILAGWSSNTMEVMT
jgi:hypothetical protein